MVKKSKKSKSTWVDPDDAPELDDTWFKSADLRHGSKLIRRGRPRLAITKQSTTLRLDADILKSFRSKGKGWQTAINSALRDWLETRV